MPNPTWPASLPQAPLVAGYQQTPQDQALRTQMDAGPPKMRRRFSAGTTQVTASLVLEKTQLATLKDFYYDTLNVVLPFDWTDHVSGQTVTYRIVAWQSTKPFGLDWQVTLALEIMP